jgi:hypothetical protein
MRAVPATDQVVVGASSGAEDLVLKRLKDGDLMRILSEARAGEIDEASLDGALCRFDPEPPTLLQQVLKALRWR